jgi:hypothetical protein
MSSMSAIAPARVQMIFLCGEALLAASASHPRLHNPKGLWLLVGCFRVTRRCLQVKRRWLVAFERHALNPSQRPVPSPGSFHLQPVSYKRLRGLYAWTGAACNGADTAQLRQGRAQNAVRSSQRLSGCLCAGRAPWRETCTLCVDCQSCPAVAHLLCQPVCSVGFPPCWPPVWGEGPQALHGVVTPHRQPRSACSTAGKARRSAP